MKTYIYTSGIFCLMLIGTCTNIMASTPQPIKPPKPAPQAQQPASAPTKSPKPAPQAQQPATPTTQIPSTTPVHTDSHNVTMVQKAYNSIASLAKTAYEAPGKFMTYFKLSDAPDNKIITGSSGSVASAIGYQKNPSATNPGWNFQTLGTKITNNIQSQKNQYTPGIVERLDTNQSGTRIKINPPVRNDQGALVYQKPTVEYIIEGQTIAENNSAGIAQAKKAAAASTTLAVQTDLQGNVITNAPQTYLGAVTDAVRTVIHTPGAIAQTLGGTRTGNFVTEASLKNIVRGAGNAVVATPGIALTAAEGLAKGAITAVGVPAVGIAAGGYYGGKALVQGTVQGAHYIVDNTPGAIEQAGKTIQATRRMIWSGNLAKAGTALGNTVTPTAAPAESVAA